VPWFSKLVAKVIGGGKSGSSLIADAEDGARWIAGVLSKSGYRADFSVESLRDVDRFFDEQTDAGQARPDGLLSQQLGPRLFSLGAYCGEVIRRESGGTWKSDEQDPQGEINLTLERPDGTAIHPVQRVMKRFQQGPQESLYAYAIALTRPVA